MTWPLRVTAYGNPAPQGSKRHLGKGVMVESSTAVKPWREAVKHAVLDYLMRTSSDPQPAAMDRPMGGPVSVTLVFTVKKPASAPKTRRIWPSKRPDLDKLVRSTLDGIGESGVWVDDAQVVEIKATKVYPGEGIHALPTPGAYIEVRRVDDSGRDDSWLLDLANSAGPDPNGGIDLADEEFASFLKAARGDDQGEAS